MVSIRLSLILGGLILLLGCTDLSGSGDEADAAPAGYRDITPQELDGMLGQGDVFLVDVHIPEQRHITGTDLVTPYNSLDLSRFPQEKNATIVVYCRSGTMSREASERLAEAGYTDVNNLVGGINAWDAYKTGG